MNAEKKLQRNVTDGKKYKTTKRYLIMEYVILKSEEIGKIEKIGRFNKDGIAEQFIQNKWKSDSSLYSLMFDGLLEEISEVEAKQIIAQKLEQEKIAA